MLATNQLTRRLQNRIFQQILRYYSMQGRIGLISKVFQVTASNLFGSRVGRYLDERSIDRNELLSSVPDERVWYYDTPEVRQIGEPKYIGDLPVPYRNQVGELRRDQPFVCEVKDVDIVGPTANPKAKNGKYISDAHGLGKDQLLRSIFIEKLVSGSNQSRPSAKIEIGVLFNHLWNDNYFHWVMDFLPRFKGVEKYREISELNPTPIIGPDPPDWKVKYLNLFGYDLASCHQHDGGRTHVDTLIVPYGVRYHRSLLEWVSKEVLDQIPDKPEKFPTNVWISRDDASCRRILNEEQVMDTLYNEGFAKVKLENMSLENSINLFKHADTIISPHGAGLADLIYSDNVSVVELFGVKEKASNFHIAEAFGHDYVCVRCDTKGEDLIADTDDVIRALRLV